MRTSLSTMFFEQPRVMTFTLFWVWFLTFTYHGFSRIQQIWRILLALFRAARNPGGLISKN